MNVCKAAKHFKVNRKSLLQRTSGEIPVNAHAGCHTTLTAAQEDKLAECIKLMATWGWGFSAGEIKYIVQEFVKTWHQHPIC